MSFIAALVSQAVGYDAAKLVLGRKRHLTVDTIGLVLRVLVTAASVPEREGGAPSPQAASYRWEPGCSDCIRSGSMAAGDGNPFLHARDGYLPMDCAGGAAPPRTQGLCLASVAIGG